MGNINSLQTQDKNSKQRKNFLQKVQKVSSDYSQRWGNYSIYQQLQKPYDYFLEYIHVSLAQRDFLQKKLLYYQNMPKHKNLVPVQYAEIVKRKQMCAQFDVLRVFCMYYNFTLQDGIKVKIKQKSSFSEGQLVYILRSLLLIGDYYESEVKARCYSGIFKCKEIFISPEGHLKIYPLNENIFGGFVQIFDRKEKSNEQIEQKKSDSLKKVGSNLDKNGLKRGEQRRGGLRTTLKQESLREANSVRQLNDLKEKDAQQSQSYFMRHQSLSNYMNRQSDQNLSIEQRMSTQQFNERNSNNNRSSNNSNNSQDWFQLGLLMMQLILLNESHQYYLEKTQRTQKNNVNDTNGFSKDKIMSDSREQSNFNNNNNIKANPKNYNNNTPKNQFSSQQNYTLLSPQCQNQQGKTPNLDLIFFSLNNLLPKKNISPTLIQIISLLLSNRNPNLTYQQLIKTVEEHQQSLTEPKYCLKFDVSNKESFIHQCSQKHFSRYIVKNQSVDPLLKTTNLSSNAFMNNDSSFQSFVNQNKLLSQSKESFFARNLDDLINSSNFSKSMIVEGQDINKSTVVLVNLKKSRKLVPTKIRSISNKIPDLPEIKSGKQTQNFQLTFG